MLTAALGNIVFLAVSEQRLCKRGMDCSYLAHFGNTVVKEQPQNGKGGQVHTNRILSREVNTLSWEDSVLHVGNLGVRAIKPSLAVFLLPKSFHSFSF